MFILGMKYRRSKMLRLEKVNAKNVWEILKLQVLENQKSFVASNNIRAKVSEKKQ